MTHEEQYEFALARYHTAFDNALYSDMAALIASSLNADRDDDRVMDLLVAAQNAAFELCEHPVHRGAWHILALRCGNCFLSFHTVDVIRDFLHLFAPNDTRIDDFEATAKALLRAYSGLDDLKTATAHANSVHSWQGWMAYELFAAVDDLTYAATLLLAHEDDGYIREKLQNGLTRIKRGLYEGVHHSPNPTLYDFTD
jgi:hypothetical protein